MTIILAIETSGEQGGVALYDGAADAVLAERALGEKRRHGAVLVPKIEEALSSAGLEPADVSRVAVAIGPGSFTGLRVGTSAAKAFAWALGVPLVPVSTLLALAADGARAHPGFRLYVPLVDAHSKGLIYSAAFRPGATTTSCARFSPTGLRNSSTPPRTVPPSSRSPKRTRRSKENSSTAFRI